MSKNASNGSGSLTGEASHSNSQHLPQQDNLPQVIDAVFGHAQGKFIAYGPGGFGFGSFDSEKQAADSNPGNFPGLEQATNLFHAALAIAVQKPGVRQRL